MTPGNLAPTILAFPLRGKAAFTLNVVDEDGAAFTLDPAYAYALSVHASPTTAAALMTLAVGSGLTLGSPYSAGGINVAFSAPQVALLSAQKLYSFLLTVTNVSLDIILSNTGRLLPSLEPLSASYATGGSGTSTLSILYVNVQSLLGETGGSGYLDGIATVNQQVGCIVEYIDPTSGQLKGWILEAYAYAPAAGSFVRPTDYNAVTNIKTWRSLY